MNMQNEKPWYVEAEEDEECAARCLNATVQRLENDQEHRITDMFKLMSLYQNRDLTRQAFVTTRLLNSMPLQIRNVSRSIIDTLVAKFVTNESKATFDVTDGDWEASERAEMMDEFCWGETYRLKLYSLYEMAMRDCAVVGDGWVKFYARDRKVFAERVFPVEMRLDPAQCVSGPPRDLYQIRYIDRAQAMAYYNEFADEIKELPTVQPPYPYPGVTRDIVRLVEAWHLPDFDDGEGGRYMFVCNDICIESDKYKRKDFPFVRFSWSPDMLGGYGLGLQEELLPLQSELNKLKKRHLEGLRIHGLPRVFMPYGSKLKPEELSNSPIQIWTHTAGKPEVDQSRCVAPELVAEEQAIEAQMWQLAGVSPLQAGTDMPSRMDSRPGLREYAAMADEKHAMPSKMWDRGILEGNRQMIAVARQIVEEHGSYEAMGAAKDSVDAINFKECDLEDDRFRIKLQNTNLLPTTPAGKRMAVQDLANAGAFQQNPRLLWMLLSDSPDVDAVIGNETAGEKLVRKQVSRMIRKREYFPPEKYQDCSYALHFASNAIQKLVLQTAGKDDERTDEIYRLLEQYCLDCTNILNAQQAEQAAQQADMMAQQQGAMPDAGLGQQPAPGGPPAGAGGGAPALPPSGPAAA